MVVSRDLVDDALFALVSGVTFNIPGYTTWVYASKHWQSWDQTANQPAVYLRKGSEKVSSQLRGLNKYVLSYEVWAYAQTNWNDPAADVLKETVNPIIEALDNALAAPEGTEYQNLGLRQVANCRIDGNIDVCDGTIDGQAVIAFTVLVFLGS